MKNDVAFICVGQAGGNIGSLFEEKGYNVMYINTSKEDLNILKNSIHKYHLKNGEGCAKNRDKAKQLLAEDLDSLIEQIRAAIPQKYVFVVFSSGGGTGSGVSPFLTEILIDEFKSKEEVDEDSMYVPEPEKYFSVVTIIPDDSDKMQAAVNSYNCCQELLDIEDLGSMFLLDNACGRDKMAINRIFVDALDHVLQIPSKHKHVEGNVDKAELKKAIFETHGVAIANYLSREKGNAGLLAASIRNNVYAPIQNDKIVLYYVTSTTNKIDMVSLANEFGEPVDIFSTYNQECNILLMSGLSFPYNRFRDITEKVRKQTAIVEKSIDSLYENGLDETLKVSRRAKRKPRQTRVAVTNTDSDSADSSNPLSAPISVEVPKKSARDMLNSYKRRSL